MKQTYLHVLLIIASAAHKRKSRKVFRELNLTEGQPKVLTILKGMEGCQQKDLASACRVEPATMTSLLKLMEEKGLIRKESCYVSGGKRAYRIFLSEEGNRLADKVMKRLNEIEQMAFDGFTDEDRNKFMELFSKVTWNLDQL